MTERASSEVEHVVVFVHGIEGHASDWDFAVPVFLSKHKDSVFVHCSHTNEDGTHDGIDVCGKRLHDEVLEIKRVLSPQKRLKLSFVCHSLGGLITRYAIGLLHESGQFTELFEPQNYITLATPHCGARRPQRTIFHKFANWFITKGFDKTGEQLKLGDSYSEDGRPLLCVLADPDRPFWQALSLFKRRVKYSNIQNDIPVPYPTAAITYKNPYHGHFDTIAMMEEYPHVVKDPLEPPTLESLSNEDLQQASEKLFAHHSERNRKALLYMVTHLNKLKWEHYDVYFKSPLAHIQIIGHPPFPPSDDVLRHLTDTFVV